MSLRQPVPTLLVAQASCLCFFVFARRDTGAVSLRQPVPSLQSMGTREPFALFLCGELFFIIHFLLSVFCFLPRHKPFFNKRLYRLLNVMGDVPSVGDRKTCLYHTLHILNGMAPIAQFPDTPRRWVQHVGHFLRGVRKYQLVAQLLDGNTLLLNKPRLYPLKISR